MEDGGVGRDGEDEGNDVDQGEDQQEVDLSHFLSVHFFLRIEPAIVRSQDNNLSLINLNLSNLNMTRASSDLLFVKQDGLYPLI